MTSPDMLSNIANLLPTGTYLAFQLLAPITTNDGLCGVTEQVLTANALFLFVLLCAVLCFSDSFVAEDGKLYYGFVTPKGLWNPMFQSSGVADISGSIYTGGGTKYLLNGQDFINAALAVVVFLTLTLLSKDITNCFYGSLASNVRKSVPLLLACIVGFIFAFSPPARKGIGYAMCISQVQLISNPIHTPE